MTAVCPACVSGPDALDPDANGAADNTGILISLPEIHCAACIAGVEKVLMRTNGVISARVNLSLKRVRVLAVPGAVPDPLIAALTDAGYTALLLDNATLGNQKDTIGNQLLMCLAIAGFAMMNVMLLSVAVWSGASDATRDMFHWISAMIALPAVIFAGRPFYLHAVSALKAGRLNMDVPISLAILLASAMSLYETMQGGQHAYFDAALSLTFFLLIGRYLDHRTRMAARSAAQELTALEVSNVTRIAGDSRQNVPIAQVALADTLFIAPGARVPVDGIITSGQSQIDRSFITGESAPSPAQTGDPLIAGDVNLTGPLEMSVTAVGEDTTLRKMAALVEVAENARNTYSGLADRAARIYAPLVHILAAVAFVGWWAVSGDVRLSLNIAIAVLIITCPCALGLAVPAVTTIASGRLFRRGYLLKSHTALERLAAVDVAVFDKTGTLTTGHASVDWESMSQDELSVLKSLCQASDHPVSRALLADLPSTVQPAALTEINEVRGSGIAARFGTQMVRLGSAEWAGETDGPALRIGDAQPITLTVSETLRDGAAQAIADLHTMGIRTILLTGDNPKAADRIAQECGVQSVQANMRPDQKHAVMQDLAARGHKVLMIGDGLNDTPALAAAHVSIAPGTAIEAARMVSDIVLLSRDFASLPVAIRVAQQSRRRVIENFSMAAVYNMVAVPVALAGFATPLLAALAMSLSSLSVLANATRIES